MMKFIALMLLAVADPAAAQSPAPSQSPAPQQSPAASLERKATTGQSGLNLKLDDAARFAAPAGGAANALPSLGGEARPLTSDRAPSTMPYPYPKDSEQAIK